MTDTDRLAVLERQVRTLRATCVAALLMTAAALAVLSAHSGTAAPAPAAAKAAALDEVRARRLVVVDQQGRDAVVVTTDNSGSGEVRVTGDKGAQGITLSDSSVRGEYKGRTTFMVGSNEDGGSISLNNSKETVVFLANGVTGSGAVLVSDRDGKVLVLLVETVG